jgi:hypothetical protein
MRTIIRTLLLTGALLLPLACLAQGQSGQSRYALRGPSLGLMFDPATAVIRPILGIPGAATLGTPLSTGFALGQAVVAPGGDFALVVAKDDFHLAVVRASDGVVQNVAPAMGGAPDLVVFSPRGSSVALYYRASGRLVVLAGLRSQTPNNALANTSTLPAAPSLVAVSEDGASLLLSVTEGDGAGLYHLPGYLPTEQSAAPRRAAPASWPPRRDPQPVTSAGAGVAQRVALFQSVSGLRFAGNGSDALVADGAASAVYLIQDASGSAQITLLGSAQNGLSQPVAVEAMDDGRVLVANAGTGKLTILHRDGAPAVSVACGCAPSVLHQLAGNTVYRLTEPSQQPMWLLDAGGLESRIVAVPPDRSHSEPAAAAKGAQQ